MMLGRIYGMVSFSWAAWLSHRHGIGDATAAGRWVASGGLALKYSSAKGERREAKPNF